MKRVGESMHRVLRVPCLWALGVHLASLGWMVPGLGAAEWTAGAGHRWRPLAAIPPGTPGFTGMAGAGSGFEFTNRLATARFVTNQIHLNGSGVALGDVDGDGACDIFLAGLDGPNALYRNLGGWRFAEVAASAGVAMDGLDCTGAVLADLDGDRDRDLVVNSIGTGTHFFLNDGRGRFTAAPGSPYNIGRGGMSLAVADTDGDGDLDLYVANYRTDTFRDQPGTRFRGKSVDGRMVLATVNGRPVTDPDLVGRYTILPGGRVQEHGEEDVFLRNEGGGRFSTHALTGGFFLDDQGRPLTQPHYDWTLSVLLRDLNGDRAPDLYVCNDFLDDDRLWFNDGTGRFHPAPPTALRHVSMFSMAVDCADVDRDGIDDLFTADMLSRTHARRHTKLGDIRPQVALPGMITDRPQYPFNQLHLGRGDGTFADVAWRMGIEGSDWTWNVALLDVDLDGFEDALLATGHELDWMDTDLWEQTDRARSRKDLPAAEVQRLKLMFPRLNLSNFAYRNREGLAFEDAGAAWRFDLPVITQGLAAADLDGDGDLDVVLNNLNDPASLLRNDAPAPRLLVRLRGRPPNTEGVGARIRVTGGPVVQSQEMVAGGRYLSGDALVRVFAAGQARELAVELTWRDGRVSAVRGLPPNSEVEVFESDAGPVPDGPPESQALFADASGVLSHRHRDEPFDDFARQALLPGRLSQSGPGVLWADLDGDGWEDLVVGAGRGGTMGVWRNAAGVLAPWPGRVQPAALGRDALGLVAWPVAPGRSEVLVALSNWEDADANGAAVARFNPGAGLGEEQAPASANNSVGPLAVADVDGDGDLDLFIGGRAVPGRFPVPASSEIRINDGGRLTPQPGMARGLLENVGMVAGAVWSDLDGDGFPELVLACDWGAVRIFHNRRGQWAAWDAPVRAGIGAGSIVRGAWPATLAALTGCWSGVASVDLDGDGRLDLVVGNWGENSRWQQGGDRPVRLYHGDYDEDGTEEVLEAVFVPELDGDAPLRTLRPVAAAMPFIRELAPDHAAFSRATVRTLLGPRMGSTRHVEVSVLASVALLNRGDAFEVRPLPRQAQRSPVFAVVPGDFDGDGREDVFLGQNFFAVHGDAARQDAGRGLLLCGDGRGGFEAWDGVRSGIRIYGEQRGAATADYDGDGRPDLVVTQNAAATVLLRNVAGRPGLRVRLVGRTGNPAAIGSVVRVRRDGTWGPAREIAGGSGWLSQNGAVAVFGTPSPASAVEVRWPGGGRTEVAVPAGAREVTVVQGQGL